MKPSQTDEVTLVNFYMFMTINRVDLSYIKFTWLLIIFFYQNPLKLFYDTHNVFQ